MGAVLESSMASTEIRTACTRDCPDACEIVATVRDGRIESLRGSKEHPVTRGFLCYRTNRFLERQYDPERLTRPLLRRGDSFEPIGWDEALDLAAETMLRIRRESGPEAIFHYRSGGSLGIMKHVTDYFFERFGPVARKSGDVCTGAGDLAQMLDFGHEDSHDLFDLLNSRTILLWGKNPYAGNVHLLPVLREAKAKGARLVLIDPVRHRTAELCDVVIQPHPGGDIALALGVARCMFERGLADPAASGYCDHFEAFRAICYAREPAEWAALAGVRAEEIETVARLYGDRPAALLVGWGMQRRAKGCATIRAVDALGAISGNLGIPGGGVSFYFWRRSAFDLSFQRGEAGAPRLIPEPLLGPGILEARDPEIRMVWVTAGNPVAMLPDSHAVARALATRELTVVVDSFLTDTARAAHLVLPTTTMLEDDDLVGAYGHHWIAEVRPVVPPPPEVRTDYEILRSLAGRVGLNGEFSGDVASWKRRLLAPVAADGATLEALAAGPVKHPRAPRVLFADRRFPTASGKVNLIHELDPAPPEVTGERPLFLMALSVDRSQGSQWSSREQRGPATATVHPESAPGFQDGEAAQVESAHGALEVVLRFDPRQRRDVLIMDKGGWLRAGRCANALVPAAVSDAGGCAVYYDTPVRLTKGTSR